MCVHLAKPKQTVIETQAMNTSTNERKVQFVKVSESVTILLTLIKSVESSCTLYVWIQQLPDGAKRIKILGATQWAVVLGLVFSHTP